MYRVNDSAILPHDGQLLEGGTLVELPRHVAEDSAVRDLVTEVDEAGNPILAPAEPHGFERFRPHERVTLLQVRLAEAQARVKTLQAQIEHEQAAADAESGAASEGEE